MKKYIFLSSVFVTLAALLAGRFDVAGMAFGLLFAWLLLETKRRQRFRFLVGPGVKERIIDSPGVLTVTPSPLAERYLAWGRSGAAMLRWPDGGVQWQRPLDGVPLALLPLDDGSLIYALADELVRLGPQGHGGTRRAFTPPLYRQSYKLHLSEDGATLVLHTPWFVQILPADLSGDGQRLTWEEVGHYIKYLALTPDGASLLLAGALLLEDSPGIEARWDCYRRQSDGRWAPAWKGAYESYNNTHLRGLQSLRQGGLYLAEVYQEGYELRFFDQDGAAVWKRAGEKPVFDPSAAWMLWENPLAGLTLTAWEGKEKRWALKPEGPLRWKQVAADGSSLCLEGQALCGRAVDGSPAWSARFVNDPQQFCVSADGARWAVWSRDKLGFISVPRDRVRA